jgi:glycosyltransferase involved in cell wall biosynthesis
MPPARCRHILIFEPDVRGHTREWIGHLARYAREERPDLRLTLAVPTGLAEPLRPWVDGQIHLQLLTDEEERRCRDQRLAASSLARWRTMQRHLSLSGADHGFFLAFDHLSLPLALRFRARRPVSGVLFRPSTHYAALRGETTTPGEKLRDLRKRLLYRLMLHNPSLRTVFSLDPYFPDHLRHPKLKPLIDPAFPPEEEAASGLVAPPEGRVVFLLFGELAERKGLIALLEALTRLGPETQRRIAVLIAGRIEAPLRPAVARYLDALRRPKTELWLHIDDRFLATAELAGLVERSDIVLAPYQRFVGSSGVMLWAARAGKPIITQDYGLIGKLTEDFGLGIAVDTTDPSELARAIERAARDPSALARAEDLAEFAAMRTPHRFAATIFAGIAGGDGSSAENEGTLVSTAAARTGHISPLC